MNISRYHEIFLVQKLHKLILFCKGRIRKISFKILKRRRHSWIGHTVRHNEFVVNILEGAIFGKNAVGRPGLQYL